MKDFKIGEFLYAYSSTNQSIMSVEIISFNEVYAYLKGRDYTFTLTLLEIKSRLESENLYLAFRRHEEALVNLVYNCKTAKLLEEIESYEDKISKLRDEIQAVNKWRKKEIGGIKVPKKTVTINCSLPTFIIR